MEQMRWWWIFNDEIATVELSYIIPLSVQWLSCLNQNIKHNYQGGGVSSGDP